MSSDHTHLPHSESATAPLWNFFGAALLLALAVWGFLHRAPIIQFADRYFMLTRDDLLMIPVGSLFFVALWRTLAHLVFLPYLKLLEQRDAAGAGVSQSAAQLAHKATLLNQDYEQRIAVVRVAEAKARSAKLIRAKEQAALLLKDAQENAVHHLEGERASMAAETENARQDILSEVDTLAVELARKALDPPAPPKALFH